MLAWDNLLIFALAAISAEESCGKQRLGLYLDNHGHRYIDRYEKRTCEHTQILTYVGIESRAEREGVGWRVPGNQQTCLLLVKR